MANQYRNIDPEELQAMADAYCDYCIESTKEVPTVKGPVSIKERHLPTTNYFLLHWLRRKHFEFYKRTNWYHAIKDNEHPLSNTIKSIDEQFKALAEDIVANEGKGIFYAKNRLGMTDKAENKNDTTYRLIDDTDTGNQTTVTA
ncbi:MAG: hypothetical protein ACO259_10740 [Bacteroidia bacterium]